MTNIALMLVIAVVAIVFYALSLWVGMKIMKVEGTFGQVLTIAAVSGLIGLIPGIGPFLGLVVMFVLIGGWLHANFWPDAVVMVVIAGFVRFAVVLFLLGFLEGA